METDIDKYPEQEQMQPITESKSSFTLKMSSKGVKYWDIKVYNNDLVQMKKDTMMLEEWAVIMFGNEGDKDETK